ncbi:hypothetical protein NDU88_004567 [Pleurodeles waltl]|uniref:Uncharacterized protein n=1 Tax=Pleurodeles waltl TaxID=8319 RepID=A0AAV7NJY0_PLEWA|nr:hypothetical protein NDU88_004567 [Pleurodeles waltl]
MPRALPGRAGAQIAHLPFPSAADCAPQRSGGSRQKLPKCDMTSLCDNTGASKGADAAERPWDRPLRRPGGKSPDL